MVETVRTGYARIRGHVLPLLAVSSLVLGTLATIVFSGNSNADYFTGCPYGYGAGATGFGSGSGIGYGYGYSQDGSTFAYGYGNQVCPPSTTTTVQSSSTTTSTTTTTFPPVGLPADDFLTFGEEITADGSMNASFIGSFDSVTTAAPGAIPDGSTIQMSKVTNPSAAQSLLPAGNNFVLGFSYSWKAPDGSTPSAKSPVTLTVTDSGIHAGDIIWMLEADGKLHDVGTATVDGSATVTFTQDPLFIISHASTTTTTVAPTTTTTTPTPPLVVPGRALVNFAYGELLIPRSSRHALLVLKAKLHRGATIEIIGYAYHDRALALHRALNARALLTQGKPMHVRLILVTKYRVNRVLVIPVKQ